MIACFDVHYFDDSARAAAVLIENWQDDVAAARYCIECTDVEPYRPGQFYQRELQPLLKVISAIEEPVQHFLIDAYCHLSADQSPGLGAHLFKKLPTGSTVTGVAKNNFRGTSHAVEVYRGQSDRPLFVTSIGMSYRAAAASLNQWLVISEIR
jgi:deoxyribonuclease V